MSASRPARPSGARFHRESRRDRYDAVVIGAGFGGLAAAALLARAGRRVLVVERHDRVGGYGHAFRRGRYRFDSAVHLVGGCAPAGSDGGLVARLLGALGLAERAPLLPVDPIYDLRLPGLSLRAPAGLDAFVEAHAARFPASAPGIRAFLDDCIRIRAESELAAEAAAAGAGPGALERLPTLRRLRRATLAQALGARVDDPAARAALAALWPYVGLAPSRASFLYFATMLLSYVADGARSCRGTFQALADLLAGAVESHGGELLLRAEVRRIAVAGGRASGVVLEHGQRIEAPLVVSNADLAQTALDLVGREHFGPRWLDRLARLEPSISAFVVYGATTLDLGAAGHAHETFAFGGLDHEDAYRAALAAEPSWLTLTAPSTSDPTLAPPGEQLFLLTTLAGYEPASRWRHDKDALCERLLALAEDVVPGLRAATSFCEAGTPRTLERYTRNAAGALYGFALSPEQVGPGRPAPTTPLPGLLLAGHWTQPGGGVYGVLASGVEAARLALGLPNASELWKALGA
ncbi:MAG TPA: NAD(P)/FAD-dependent oxidoreductase [Myxococcota bacterium]|nr:NAD(P)/FAD-dependent oxidoreductase [Myxococcota bacterium]